MRRPPLFLPAKLVAEGAKVPAGWVPDPLRDGWSPVCSYPSCACAFLWCEGKHPPCPITGRRHKAMRQGPGMAKGAVPKGRGYPGQQR